MQGFHVNQYMVTVPSTFTLVYLSEFTPENGWLEDDPFLFGIPLFSGAIC